jgi:hypothetical protein
MKNKITPDVDNIQKYNSTGQLSGKVIECNTCNALITCFSTNLTSKVKKYNGIENLLREFVCRKCVSASKPVKTITVKVRKVRKTEKNPGEKTRYDIPKMVFSEKRNVLLASAPDLIQSVSSNGSCIRPDIFLDNDRSCNGCSLFEHCLAPIKNLGKIKR